MSRRNHFSLLLVRGDGSRVLRLNFPKALIVGGVACVVLSGAAIGVLAVDWAQLFDLRLQARNVVEQARGCEP